MEERIITKFADAWKVYGTKYDWFNCRKKPVVIKAIQMDSDFKVATKEGVSLAGKAGDYLLEGIKGEVYPCNREIFEETYNMDDRVFNYLENLNAAGWKDLEEKYNLHEDCIERHKIIDFIKANQLPNSRGVSQHGKGFREGVNTVLSVLELIACPKNIDKQGQILCPKCGKEMSYTPAAIDREVMTTDGLKLWSFRGFHRCKSGKCRYVIEDKEVTVHPTDKSVGIRPTTL